MFKRLFVWRSWRNPKAHYWMSSVCPRWRKSTTSPHPWYWGCRDFGKVLILQLASSTSIFGIDVPRSPNVLLEIRKGKYYAEWVME